jgi:hypothetical protein
VGETRTVTAVRVLVIVAAGLMGLAIVIARVQDGTFSLGIALQVLVGWSYAACGVFLWARRPANRLGLLMTTVGMLWLIGRTLLLVPAPIASTTGMWLSDLWAAAFALFLLSFPTGRLTSRLDHVIVGAFLFVSVPLEFLWLLFYVPPSGLNALAIAPDENAARVIDIVQRATLSVGAVLLAGSLGRRWLHASGPVRRAMAPVLVGTVAVLLSSVEWILFALGASLELLELGILMAQIAIPIGILFVMLRSRLARAGVADLVVELGQTPTPARLRDALANALGDPSLQVAWWDAARDAFVDAAGGEVALPEDGAGQAVTTLERDGVPEAAIIHDAILLEEPGLMASVASAMRLAVANDRLTTEVPDYWIPLMPVRTEGGLRLRRGAVLKSDGSKELVRARGRILEAGQALSLFDEEVPREGARVIRTYQFARWIDGSSHFWIGRRKGAGRGEGSSGLKFDALIEAR